MPSWLAFSLPVLLAYVAGATPFGWLAGRLRGLDLREHGSGNIGATNAVRVLGKRIGIPVFGLDLLKGWLPVALALWWVAHQPAFAGRPLAAQTVPVLAGLGAVLGHTFTFWLGFKGGKGVATSAGVMLGLTPLALLTAVVAWAASMKISRYVSLSSIIASWVLPAAVGLLGWWSGHPNPPLLALALAIGGLVTVRHRANLGRIAAGTEPKVGARRSVAPPES
jgi:glycerol-3-phosphate acyltransferase PlsY